MNQLQQDQRHSRSEGYRSHRSGLYTQQTPEQQRDAIDRIVIQIIALVRGIILEGGIVWKAFSKSVGHSQREQT